MRVKRDFFERDTLTVAKELLGKVLVFAHTEGVVKGKIVETEGYLGIKDRAAHAYSGVPTPRTQVLYGQGGHAYVYLIYGMYHCLNMVTEGEGIPECVLIRALEPVAGIRQMERRRRQTDPYALCSGPGKLCQAMGITKEANGMDLCQKNGRFYLETMEEAKTLPIVATKRIGIDYAGEARDFLWRFAVADNPYVSGAKKRK